jgi:hypothetical protein
MNRLFLLAALATAFGSPAFAATDDELKKAIVGSWGDAADCSTGVLVFTADGSFASSSGTDPGDAERGTYTLVGGKLNGSAGEHVMPEVTVIFDGPDLYFQNEGGSKDRLYPCKK